MTTEAFGQQAAALRAQLLSVARLYLGNADEAEDIVQDAMLKLWLMREGLTLPILGIATVVTRNLCIDALRRRKPAVDISQLAEEESPADDGEQIEQMLRIIDTLPSAQRAILRMRHLDGMEMKDIALVLGSTEVAVRQTLSRARRTVRRKLIAWLAAASLLVGVAGVAVHWLRMEREEECVAIVYGKRYTDEQTVMKELKRTMGEVVEDNPQDEVEQQLNELFSD